MLLHVQIKPNQKIDQITVSEASIVIRIKARPQQGEANKYLIKFLAKVFNLPKSAIAVVKGHTNPHKTISIDADEAYINSVLDALSAN
jgi:uncharacterized protein (TIGR00251 family)